MTAVTAAYPVQINRPPDKVFAYVTDLTKHGEWSGAPLTVVAAASGPVGVGSQYRSKGDVLNQKDRPNELRVTEYQPPTAFGFVAQDATFGAVTHRFTFAPQASGTLVTRTVSFDIPAPMAFLFNVLIGPLVGHPTSRKAMASLKTKMESQ